MNRIFHLSVGIVATTALIGLGWWLQGYNVAELRPDAPAWLASLVSFPLFFAAAGLAMMGMAAVTKRDCFTTPSKANWLAASALLFGPSLCLVMQAGMPLMAYGHIEKSSLMTMVFAMMVSFFLMVGNFITTTRRDGFGGLRNRYTLADDVVWAKSQRGLGRGIVIASLVGAPTILFFEPMTAIYSLAGLKVTAVLVAHAWSWRLSRNMNEVPAEQPTMIDAHN